MTAERSVFLRHALDCIDFVVDELAQIDGQQFLQNRMLRDAVLRNLEVIGQACKDYGIAELEHSHPDIRWRRVAGFRNQLAHEYLGLDIELVWNIVREQLPSLRRAIAEHLDLDP
jgi:uncharacterized protein with HEPN domain